jgi:uncharacterized protein YodC (DUF2158 family)
MEVKEGDIVQIKSGGKQMTVEVIENGYASCVYTDDFGDVKREELAVAVLKVIQ